MLIQDLAGLDTLFLRGNVLEDRTIPIKYLVARILPRWRSSMRKAPDHQIQALPSSFFCWEAGNKSVNLPFIRHDAHHEVFAEARRDYVALPCSLLRLSVKDRERGLHGKKS